MSNTTASKKKQNKQYIDTNPIEAIRDIGNEIIDTGSDFGKGVVSDLWSQLLGAEQPRQTHGDLQQGEELDLSTMSQKQQAQQAEAEKKEKLDIEPGIDYRREILHGEKRIAQENTRGLESQIQQIVNELKRLASSSQVLEAEFREITVEQRIEHAGAYHVSFFEWMLTVVRTARMRVEDSGAWLGSFKSKKKQKQYWQQFKKHGTSFGLSNERTVATQTG